MLNKCFKKLGSGRFVSTSAVFLGFVLATNSALSANSIDPESDKILKSMSSYMASLSAFTVNIEIANEIITTQGQKLQLNDSTKLIVKRPEKLNVKRQGLVGMELTFDSQTLTIYSKEKNAYFQSNEPKTVDDVIDAVRTDIGLDIAGADLIYADPYPDLASGVTSSSYLGTAYVDGIECHHLAFREDKFDWQLWVKADNEPLPMKYVITTRMMVGAPQYSVRYRDWNTLPKIDDNQFKFSAPAGASKRDIFLVDEMGQLVIGGSK